MATQSHAIVQEPSSSEQVERIYRIQFRLQLQRFDVLFFAHCDDVIPNVHKYEQLTCEQAEALEKWLLRMQAEDPDMLRTKGRS